MKQSSEKQNKASIHTGRDLKKIGGKHWYAVHTYSGYEDAVWETVSSVDGRSIGGLAELVSLVERSDGGPFVSFVLGDGSRVTIDRQRAVATAPEVLARYEVPADRSPRLRALADVGKQVAAASDDRR